MAESKDDIAKMNIYQKVAAITGEIGVIKKAGRNRDQGYEFIEYAAVAGELRTLFAKYNVVIVPRMQQTDKQNRVEMRSAKGSVGYHTLIDFSFNVINADQPEDKFTVSWTGESTAWDDKGTNKAATSALKYYLMRQFNISEKGEDPDGTTPSHEVDSIEPVATTPKASPNKPASQKQLDLITIMLQDAGYPDDQIVKRMAQVKSSADASALIEKIKNKGVAA